MAFRAVPYGSLFWNTRFISGLFLYLIYLLASYKGIPNVLIVMGILIALFTLCDDADYDRPADLRTRWQ